MTTWRKIYWAMLDLWYTLIRPLVVPDVDPNEDFYCMQCEKPVLKRYLYCSKKCSEEMWTTKIVNCPEDFMEIMDENWEELLLTDEED